MTLTFPYQGKTVTLQSDSKTEYGEDQIWLQLSDESSIELTEERNGTVPMFYSLRVHVSPQDMDAGKHEDTNGIALTLVYNTIPELERELASLLADLDVAGVQADLS